MDFNKYSLEDLFDQYSNPAEIREAKQTPTVRTGQYTLKIVEAEIRDTVKKGVLRTPEGGPGGAHLSIDILKDGKKAKRIWTDVSWVMVKDPNTGRPDKFYRRWSQLLDAVYPMEKTEDQAKHSVKEVINTALSNLVLGFVTEAYKDPADPNGALITADSEDDAKKYQSQGWEGSNFLQNFTKPKKEA